MKKKIKLSANFIIYFTSLLLTSFINNPFDSQSSTNIAKKHHGGHGKGHGGHHGHHRGRHHRHYRDGVQFRFDLGPSRRYYDYPYYYDYTTLFCEILNEGNTRVTEVQIGNRVIYSPSHGSSYNFSLRPGYYKIRWRVENDKYFGEKYRNYSKTIRVHQGLDQVYVVIKGSNISVRYVGF